MKVIGRHRLAAFKAKHANCRKWVDNWIIDAESAQWKNTHDIKARYPSASFLHDNVVIFNVKGNDYRLEVRIAYKTGIISVRWLGTHAEYTNRFS